MMRKQKKIARRWLAGLLCMLMLLPSNFSFTAAAEADDTGQYDVSSEEQDNVDIQNDTASQNDSTEQNENVQPTTDVIISTTMGNIGYTGGEYDLLKDVTVSAATDADGNEIKVRIQNIVSTDASYSWDGTSTTITPQSGGVTYTIVYEAYADTSDGEVTYATYSFDFSIQGDSEIGEMLDGDYAYISDAYILPDSTTQSGYAIRTGSAPWDEDDEAGDDSSDLNNTVRSFDIVSYTVGFTSKVRDNAPYKAYKMGTLHFEFVLPGDSSQVQFETGSMGWLSAKRNVEYTITEETYNGQTYQVLRGSYLWEPSDQNPTAIGESYQELGLVTRVLAMKQGESMQPKFTFWLDYNDIPTDELVTDSNYSCTTHGEQEYKTITGPSVTVTSAPRYNLRIVNGYSSGNQAAGSFDFSTGNELAANKDAGTKTGRIQAFGVVIQIVGKSAADGLRGCELPNGDPITFDLTLSSTYRTDTGTTITLGDDCAPLLWSIDGNMDGSTQADGRSLSLVGTPCCYFIPTNSGTFYNSCYQGGTWTGAQEGNTIHVTVSNYSVDLTHLPYTDFGNSNSNCAYYDPNNISGYWDVQTACFSAGEIWVVQPFYDKNNTYIVDQYGASGSFQIGLEDKKLQMTGESGVSLKNVEDNSNQEIQTDDQIVQASYLMKKGSATTEIMYHQYNNSVSVDNSCALTKGCANDGKDWILDGDNLGILGRIYQVGAEGQNRFVAADYLMKFDDAFFELESCFTSDSDGKILYGAKPDKTGWSHKGKKPNETGYDTEMMQSTADDLIFFSSLEELQSKGYTCVAVLCEVRQNFSSQRLKLLGHTKKDADLNGYVFMVTDSAVAWSQADAAEAAAAYCGKAVAELTDDDYQNYAQNAFPSREGKTEPLSYTDDYPAAVQTWDYESTPARQNYQKARYDENGYAGGSAGRNAGDSCLVVSYTTQITKDTKQSVSNTGNSKDAYDLDVGQRIADFVLSPSAIRVGGESLTENARITTDIYIEDTLPAGLTYIPFSSRWGGTYTQTDEGKQGKIEGGQSLEPEVTTNADGTTTLRWTLKNVVVTEQSVTNFEPIYYSCDIGTSGNEEADVQNNQQLLNTAIIWSKDEQKREFNAANNNKAAKSILVSKNNAISLSKTADHTVVDAGEEMGFTMSVGNNSSNGMDVIALDSLPYNGDAAGSRFTGECQVTEFTVTSTALLENFKLYYTTDENERGKSSSDYKASDFSNTAVWVELTADPETGKVTLPENLTPVAVAAVGRLNGNQTLKMHISVLLPDGQSGDYVANRLTRGNLESYGRSYVVSRTLEGVAWLDTNANGLRADSETLLDGVTATLVKLKDGGDADNLEDYEVYTANSGQAATVQTGQQMDLNTGNVTAYDAGSYRFTNLPAGTFGVLFSDGTVSLGDYVLSPADQGNDDTIDSDATGCYTADKTLEKAFVLGIVMPETKQITTLNYTSKGHDLGLYAPAELSFTKVKAENTSEGLSGAEFKLYMLTCTDSSHTHSDLIDPENPADCWTLKDTQTSDPEVTFSDLIPGEYRLVETKAPTGRALPAGQWKVIVGDGKEITITAVGTTQPPAFAVSDDGDWLLPNMRPMDIPSSGSIGAIPFTIIGALLMGSGLVTGFYLQKRKRKAKTRRSRFV